MKHFILSLNALFFLLGDARVLSSAKSTDGGSTTPSTSTAIVSLVHKANVSSTASGNLMTPSTIESSTFHRIIASSTPRISRNTTGTSPQLAVSTASGYSRLNATKGVSPYPTASSDHGNLTGNVPLNECWSQWSSFWDPSNWNTSVTPVLEEQTFTVTSTTTQTWSVQSAFTRMEVETVTSTYDMYDGDFNLGPVPYTTTLTAEKTYDAVAKASTATQTSTMTFYNQKYVTFLVETSHRGPTPSCPLPASVSQCQVSWNTWVSNNIQPRPTSPPGAPIFIGTSTPSWYPSYSKVLASWIDGIASPQPICTQATIASSNCQSLVDAYVTGNNFALVGTVVPWYAFPTQSAGYYGIMSAEVRGTPTHFDSPKWIWPTSARVGLDCTVGCGRCAVTANSVQLLYWPPATETPSTGPVTLETLGTTLTSPTLYVSYSKIYASDVCKGVGGTYTNTIVPIPATADLSSVWGVPHLVNGGSNNPTIVELYTSAFNVSDLYHTPVPMSIYSSQPWCATWAFFNNALSLNWIDSMGWTCPSTRPYEPIIVIPSTILAGIDPEWATCHGALKGAYDPPSALSPAPVVASATLPAFFSTSVAAIPVQGPSSNLAATPTTIPPSSPPTMVANSAGVAGIASQTLSSPDLKPSIEFPFNSPNPSPDPSVQPNFSLGQSTSISIGDVASQPVIINPATPGVVMIGGNTLTIGQQTIVADTPISIGTGSVVIGTNTIALTPAPQPEPTTTMPDLSGPLAIISLPLGGFLVGTQTLTAAGPALTLGGTTFSALPSNTGIIVGSDGHICTVPGAIIPIATAESLTILSFTADDVIYTASVVAGASEVWQIDGTTFSLSGAPATIGRVTLSAASGGVVIDASSTIGLSTATAAHNDSNNGSDGVVSSTTTGTLMPSRAYEPPSESNSGTKRFGFSGKGTLVLGTFLGMLLVL